MLIMKNVSKTFNPGTVNEKCALKNLNLELKDGDFATIIGSNGAGKSTLFNAITKAGAEAANFPFCTIEPNVGIVEVPDHRIYDLAKMFNPKKITPAFTRFVDIAGLVAGASKGEGLGNQFLSHIRETDAVAHVVRCFESGDITHVEGTVDPVRDMVPKKLMVLKCPSIPELV